MTMPRSTSRGRHLKRRSPSKEPKKRILVLCEGRVTETGYFKALRRIFRSSLVELEIDAGGGVVPKTLVERAALRKKESDRLAKSRRDVFLKFDDVWCVFDVDAHPNLADARQQAHDNGINLAISNPCFELWALLHFQDQTAYLKREDARRLLKKHLPNYKKELPFAHLHPGYDQAVQRAIVLDRRREEAEDCEGNPSTGVYRLTEKVRKGE